MRKVVIANDHGAVEIKEAILAHLRGRGFEVENLGVDGLDSVDYPDMAEKACRRFLEGGFEFGILCCGTGIGISIAANKIDGIRCALPQNSYAASMAREHNDANFIAFGGRIEYTEPLERMLDAYIDAEHQGGRHANRVKKMMDLEL